MKTPQIIPGNFTLTATPVKLKIVERDLLDLEDNFKLQEGQGLIINAVDIYRPVIWEKLLRIIELNPRKITVNISRENISDLEHGNFAWMKILQHKQAGKVQVNVMEDNDHTSNSIQAA